MAGGLLNICENASRIGDGMILYDLRDIIKGLRAELKIVQLFFKNNEELGISINKMLTSDTFDINNIFVDLLSSIETTKHMQKLIDNVCEKREYPHNNNDNKKIC